MSKLSKVQAKAHAQACRLLEQDALSENEKLFVLENWQESAKHINTIAGAFFTRADPVRHVRTGRRMTNPGADPMTERDEMVALADEVRNFRPWDASPEAMDSLLAKVEKALRSAARTDADAGYGAGFEAGVKAARKVTLELRDKYGSPTGDAYSNGLWDQSQRIAAAIAALPAQGGKSVTVEELARFLSPDPDRCVFGSGGIFTDANGKTTSSFSCSRYAWEDQISPASRLLSTFTITRKSEERP